jgi:hypothetical protein
LKNSTERALQSGEMQGALPEVMAVPDLLRFTAGRDDRFVGGVFVVAGNSVGE